MNHKSITIQVVIDVEFADQNLNLYRLDKELRCMFEPCKLNNCSEIIVNYDGNFKIIE